MKINLKQKRPIIIQSPPEDWEELIFTLRYIIVLFPP